VLGEDRLLELFDRYGRRGEQVRSVTRWPDGVLVQTDRRLLSIRVDRAGLAAARAPWVAALVLIEREDTGGHGARETDAVLVGTDGREHHLNDPAVVAGLGAHLDPSAYAEVLVSYHPWTAGRRELDPSRPPAVRPVAGGRQLTFFSTETWSPAPGAPPRGAVYSWTVDLPADGATHWDRRLREDLPLPALTTVDSRLNEH
jgi:hypothetical protein